MLVLILTFILLSQVPSTVFSQQSELEGGGIVYGDEIGAGVQAQNGWIFDSQSGNGQGLYAVMYPQGSTWANAKVVMYVNIAKMEKGENLSKFIEGDLSRFKDENKDIVSKESDPIKIIGSKIAQVREYSGDKWGNFEEVAYISENSSVVMYVLSSRDEKTFRKSLPAFRKMVAASFLAAMVFDHK